MDSQALLTSAKCFICVGVSEDEALELALLSSIGTSPPTLDLFIQSGGDVGWVWNEPSPDHWTTEWSIDGVDNWTSYQIETGSARSTHLNDNGLFYRIVGNGEGGDIVTPYSNVIFIPS